MPVVGVGGAAGCENAKPKPDPKQILKKPKATKRKLPQDPPIQPPAPPRPKSFQIPPNFVLRGRFRIVKRIAAGSFGEVYLAFDMIDNVKVAVKFSANSGSLSYEQLAHEQLVYMALKGIEGIPKLRWAGYSSLNLSAHHAIVMDLEGASLEALFQVYKRFTLGTVLMLSIQILHLLEQVHERGYVHRDIKPDNFVMGVIDPSRPDEAAKVYVVDFGLAKLYRDSRKNHIVYKTCGYLIGTVRYASTNAHRGLELSRRDDLESLGYMMIYFLKGKLPWQGVQMADRNNRERSVGALKIKLAVEELCRGLPHFFANYIKYCRTLGFTEQPNYVLLRTQMKDLLKETYNVESNYKYDWLREDCDQRIQIQSQLTMQ